MLQEYEIWSIKAKNWSIKAKKPRVKSDILKIIILALHLYTVLLFEFRTAEEITSSFMINPIFWAEVFMLQSYQLSKLFLVI